ncbi:e124a, partial [Murid betaherpesvirus 8]
ENKSRTKRSTHEINGTLDVGVSSVRENRPARWIQPLSTILAILFMFGFIMVAVACNIWCMNGDDLSSHGDSILDIELASSSDPKD